MCDKNAEKDSSSRNNRINQQPYHPFSPLPASHIFGFGLLVGSQCRFLELLDEGQQVCLIFQPELLVDDVQVPHRVHLALHVCHVIVIKRPCRAQDAVQSEQSAVSDGPAVIICVWHDLTGIIGRNDIPCGMT